ncbi:putative gastrointestinal growth factor xP1 [Xenopus laevis]|uniref:P-type domain-containing protein n=2 Tax=Xenopus laevis TaxID=8355 RepID=A0A974HXE2_XENLA|nr:putative gastrointestinal growth factor xP1 [Xenopus laevis]OCT93693.1 hypothetical protein XELAEV_18011368mg [Xenopus laevis]
MDYKVFCLVAIALIVGSISSASVQAESTKEQCSVERLARVSCGYSGITPDECTKKGCCFDNTIYDAIWCFNPRVIPAEDQCSVGRLARVNCGYSGITPDECTKEGCCYDNTIQDAIWCFNPRVIPDC